MPLGKLTVGAFGDEVRDLHSKLRQRGFDLPVAEVERRFYGPGTQEAVNAFQRAYGLKVTGSVDVAMETALQGAIVTQARKPATAQSTASAMVEPSRMAAKPDLPIGAGVARLHELASGQQPRGNRSQGGSADYAARDAEGRVAFYVLLWKRKGLALDAFDDYWRDVHGPVCARLPGQFQYWQFHVAHNEGGVFPAVEGVNYSTAEEDQFDGIAELTFRSVADRQTWFDAAGILMDDEHNIFSKAIGYVTEQGQSKTYVDGIALGDPNGDAGLIRFHVLLRQAPGVGTAEFRRYMTDTLAANVARSDKVLKFRLHLFEPPDVSRPDAAGVVHYEPPEKQYQAAFEMAFRNHLEMELFFASPEYAAAVREQARYVKQANPLPERNAYTFVYDGRMTLAGQRGSQTAQLITHLGATNQLRADIHDLVVGKIAREAPTAGSKASGTAKAGVKPNLAQIYSPVNL
jgi:peptidoglycan hydrolase-like protein with peptidoglycan-binding domain